MKKFLNGKSYISIVFIGGLLAITFLAYPVLAQEITPSEKLEKANELATQASEMAIKARETGDAELAGKALELANEAAKLVSEIAATAKATGNAELAQAVLNVANNIKKAINLVGVSAESIAQTSTDPATVAAANEIKENSEKAGIDNQENITTALASGAVPGPPEAAEAFTPPAPTFTIPVQEEPPIVDTQAASQV